MREIRTFELDQRGVPASLFIDRFQPIFDGTANRVVRPTPTRRRDSPNLSLNGSLVLFQGSLLFANIASPVTVFFASNKGIMVNTKYSCMACHRN